MSGQLQVLDHNGEPDWYPILTTMQLIKRKWHLVIIHRLLMSEPLGFSDLNRKIDEISGKMLADSLDDLERKSLIDRTVVKTRPFRVEYSLTSAGKELEPVVSALRKWGLENAPNGQPN